MTKRVVICTAAVPLEFERRLAMAARLLAASAFEVDVQPWDGTRHELLVADADDAYGRAALDVARRRGDAVLRLSRDAALASVAHEVQIAELTHVLRRLLGEPEANAERANHASGRHVAPPVAGLLAVWPEAWQGGADFAAVSGAFALTVRRRESRVVARSHSDLAAARARFTRESWTIDTGAQHAEGGDADLWQSVDAFLIEACVANEGDLPAFDGAFQLASWPDMGTLHDGEDVMRLAAAMSKRPMSVNELALRCRVGKPRANAFCWAMRASGLLATGLPVPRAAAARESAAPAPLSIVARLARRFGLSFGERP